MAGVVFGNRVGKLGKLAVGCSAWIFNADRGKILLVQRADNGRWAVPGGFMDPGESLTEACKREVQEESGLDIQIGQLIAVYTNPHMLLTYPDGNKWQLVVMHFSGEVLGGKLRGSNETLNSGYFSRREIEQLDIGEFDRLRINDGFRFEHATLIRENVRI